MRPANSPKPPLTDAEFAAIRLMQVQGQWGQKGLRAIAHHISNGRGAGILVSPEARRERSVSAMWLKRQLDKRNDTPTVTTGQAPPENPQTSQQPPIVCATVERISSHAKPGRSQFPEGMRTPQEADWDAIAEMASKKTGGV